MGSSASKTESQTTEENNTTTNEPFVNLKCTVCHKYLSIPPIMSSSDRRIKKCGREPCNSQSSKNITAENLSRDVLYEELAKLQTFPCGVSEKCLEKMPWIKVLDHESVCPYRKITCPKKNCCQQFELKDAEEHFGNLHTEYLVQETRSFCNHEWHKPHFDEIFLFKTKEIQFFLYVRLELESSLNMEFNAFAISFPKQTFKYTMKFENSHSKYFTTDYTLILFPNTLDCNQGDLSNVFLQTIDVFNLNKILGSLRKLTISINNEENPNHLCNLVIADMTAIIPDLMSCFNCPICFELMDSEIVLCTKGHSICKQCQIQINQTNKSCPLCESPFSENSRNYMLEELAIKFSCLKLAKK